MKKSTVLSLTTAAVILAAYAPNEVVLADTSSSEDALSISDKEKVVVDKETENKEKHKIKRNIKISIVLWKLHRILKRRK
ncbi:serine protease [Streptococcus pneumoniae]|nr:serine protease [Streptococcus pneumoniae]